MSGCGSHENAGKIRPIGTRDWQRTRADKLRKRPEKRWSSNRIEFDGRGKKKKNAKGRWQTSSRGGCERTNESRSNKPKQPYYSRQQQKCWLSALCGLIGKQTNTKEGEGEIEFARPKEQLLSLPLRILQTQLPLWLLPLHLLLPSSSLIIKKVLDLAPPLQFRPLPLPSLGKPWPPLRQLLRRPSEL